MRRKTAPIDESVGKIWRGIVAFCAVLAALMVLAVSAAASPPARGAEGSGPGGAEAGAYLWGGLLEEGEGVKRVHASFRFMLDQGFGALRFTLTRNSLPELGLDAKACPSADASACYLNMLLDDPVFDDARLKILMITLHEGGVKEAIADGLTPERRTAMATELRSALEFLQRRFEERSIRIVISNWEGDNMVYCASVMRYIRSEAIAQSCDSEDGQGIARRLDHFADWIDMRDDVIASFRAEHPGIDVIQAPEFNIAVLNARRCVTACNEHWTVFDRITRDGLRPLCSYSSYNSTNRSALGTDLERLLEGCQALILGEVGFAEARQGADKVNQNFESVADAIAAHPGRIPAYIIWNAFNEPGRTREDSFGLFNSDGTPGNIQNLPAALRP